MKKALIYVFLLCSATACLAAINAAKIANKYSPTVVRIDVVKRSPGGETVIGHGSGVFISPEGLILTAYHVVSSTHVFQASTRDSRFTVEVFAVDKVNDIALLRPVEKMHKMPYARLGKRAVVGQEIVVIGFPMFMDLATSTGIVSTYDDDGMMIATSAVAPGSSGGPAFNSRGEVVGLAECIFFINNEKSPASYFGFVSVESIRSFLRGII